MQLIRYIRDGLGILEVAYIYLVHGEKIPTYAIPKVKRTSKLNLTKVKTRKNKDMLVLLDPSTASWCVVDQNEYEICKGLDGITYKEFKKNYSQVRSETILNSLLTALFQRGLLKINGRASIKQDIYDRGPLFHNNYLIEILITEKCNLVCEYCFAEASKRKKDMPLSIGYKIIDEAMKIPSPNITFEFAGGEVLSVFDTFKKLVYYIETVRKKTRKNARIIIQTNCTLINDEIASFIKSHNIRVGVSLDGPKTINDKTRYFYGRKGSYDDKIKGIETLKKNNISFGLLTVITKHNYCKAEEIAKHFVSIGCQHGKFNPVFPIGRATHHWEDLAITAAQYFAFMKDLLNCIINEKLPFVDSNLIYMINNIIRRTRDYRCMRSPCGAGEDYIVVDPRGDLYPCARYVYDDRLCMGNITDVNGTLHLRFMKNKIVKELKKRTVKKISTCSECDYRHFCEGGCSLAAYQEHKTLYEPSPLCEFYQKMYPYLLNYLIDDPNVATFFVPMAEYIDTDIHQDPRK